MFIEESIVEQAIVTHDLSLREKLSKLYSLIVSDAERTQLEKEYMRRLEAVRWR